MNPCIHAYQGQGRCPACYYGQMAQDSRNLTKEEYEARQKNPKGGDRIGEIDQEAERQERRKDVLR